MFLQGGVAGASHRQILSSGWSVLLMVFPLCGSGIWAYLNTLNERMNVFAVPGDCSCMKTALPAPKQNQLCLDRNLLWWRQNWLRVNEVTPMCHWGHRGWQGGVDTLNVFLNCSFGTRKKALDIPKALHSAAKKLVLQVAGPEYLELMGRNKTVEESWVNLTHPLDGELKLLLFISPLSQSSLCSLDTSGSWSPAVLASREGWRFGNSIWSFLCQTWGVSCELLPQLRVPRLEVERKIKF